MLSSCHLRNRGRPNNKKVNSKKKIVTLKGLCQIVANSKALGKKIIFTNGCFDILHAGHVSYLEKAKQKNSILIVGLNSDSSVRKIKDKTRPINQQYDRAKVLASLESVDFIMIFNETTPINLIKKIKPDFLVKGADWKGKKVAGEDFVRSYGGEIKLVEYLKNHSTTKIIGRILKLCRK